MSHEKQAKALADIIKPYGLVISKYGGHRRIETLEGRLVYTFSGSPSRPYFAKNTLKDLINMGVVPSFEWENRNKVV